MKKMPFQIILSIIAFFLSSHYAVAGLIVNGGFETANFAGRPFIVDANADTGSNAVRREAGGTLGQSTLLNAGAAYPFSAKLLAIQNLGRGNNGGSNNIDGGIISALIEGLNIYPFDVTSLVPESEILDGFSVDYTAATTGLTDVSFYFSRQYSNGRPKIYHYLDNIELTPIVQVSESGALGLLVLGSAVSLFSQQKINRC